MNPIEGWLKTFLRLLPVPWTAPLQRKVLLYLIPVCSNLDEFWYSVFVDVLACCA